MTGLYMAFSQNPNLKSDCTVARKSIESLGVLSSKMVISLIPHSECKTKGEVSLENTKPCWDCYRHFGLSSRLSMKPETPTGTGWISQRDIYTLPAQEAHQPQHTLTYLLTHFTQLTHCIAMCRFVV